MWARRRQFGRAIADFQVTQFKLADMATALESARLMVWRAAAALDAGETEATLRCAMAKRLATDAGFEVCNEALQLHGGYGYLRDHAIERYLRDLRVHQILEGTNEIMRVIIARRLLTEGLMPDFIEFGVAGALGRVHLNSPSTFNALTRDMCIAFRAKLLEWADDPAIGAVAVSGEGDRAFCAGGDIRALYDSHRAGDDTTHMFFWDEYRLDFAVHEFPKPYVALVDGIVMGGGVGISVHGSHRVMTERTTFAMPECGIGLFPDVGGTAFLPRAPGELGMYLALTGARMKAADAIHAGIGTHYMPSARLDDFLECLSNVDPAGESTRSMPSSRHLPRTRGRCRFANTRG